MKVIFILAILFGCSQFSMKVAEDFVEGEVKTSEKITEDLSKQDQLQGKKRPEVVLISPIVKF